jgi:hypothetical protein
VLRYGTRVASLAEHVDRGARGERAGAVGRAGRGAHRHRRPRLQPVVKSNSSFNLFSLGTTVSYSPDVFGGTRRLVEQQAALAQSQDDQDTTQLFVAMGGRWWESTPAPPQLTVDR